MLLRVAVIANRGLVSDGWMVEGMSLSGQGDLMVLAAKLGGRDTVGLGLGLIHKYIITSFNCILIRIDPIELGNRSKTIPEA